MSELRFDERVAIVTGAGGGLGRAYAGLLASRGARVLVNDIDRKDDAGQTPAEVVVAEIEAAGGKAVAYNGSIGESGAGAAAVEAALDSFGTLDILVNNAGIVRDRSFGKMSAEELTDVWDVHFRGAFELTQAAWNGFRDQNFGRVVMTTSVAGLFGNMGQANYSSAKAALVGLARTLSAEGERFNIKANLISPGAATGMTAAMLPEELHGKMSPDRVAPMVAYLCHDTCEVAGEIFFAVAGRFARNLVVVTEGYQNPDATIEDIAINLESIMDPTNWSLPGAAIELPK